ncbi:MAG: PAS domain S-box protein [Chloroflexi bacterium]|nr:PAS domain S-box protein [Chloroflexota bacterium]
MNSRSIPALPAPPQAGGARPAAPQRLQLRPPIRQRRFWEIQALIAAVTIFHVAFEHLNPDLLGPAYFIPASLYLFPVIYASFYFGFAGAFPTAVVCAALATPGLFVTHAAGARVGETIQIATILLLSMLVAARVDRETVARRASERSERERAVSETKYRALFENAGEPILVVDQAGTIREANAAAARLGIDLDQRGRGIDEQLGPGAQEIRNFLGGHIDEPGDFSLQRVDGSEIWVQPVFTSMPDGEQEELTQVLLRDVTDRHGFQHYAQQITRAQEDERKRIAQELHDVSVQAAILVCRRLDSASAAVESEDPAAAMRSIAEARHTAETMADELRRFSRDLRPLILEDLGLVPALKRLVTELQERSEMQARFEVHGQARRLDAGTELVLFRIGQEALRNAEQHGSPTRVSLRLTFERDAVRLGVVDNGAGFVVSPSTALVTGSLGLLGMQERARLVGGRCQIRSKPGEGTRVTAEIPIDPSRAGSTAP